MYRPQTNKQTNKQKNKQTQNTKEERAHIIGVDDGGDGEMPVSLF